MKEELKNKIIEVANYIIENKVTINECSEHFNISVSSIKKYINKEISNIEATKIIGVSRGTFFRIVKEYKNK